MSFSPVRVTNVPAIKNAPLVGLAEGNGYFSNTQLAVLVIGVPWLLKRILPIVNRGGLKTYIFLLIIIGLPVTVAYWTAASMYGRPNVAAIDQTEFVKGSWVKPGAVVIDVVINFILGV